MEEKYILIFEDGSMAQTNAEPSVEDFEACDDGYLEIIRVSDCARYVANGVFESLEVLGS